MSLFFIYIGLQVLDTELFSVAHLPGNDQVLQVTTEIFMPYHNADDRSAYIPVLLIPPYVEIPVGQLKCRFRDDKPTLLKANIPVNL